MQSLSNFINGLPNVIQDTPTLETAPYFVAFETATAFACGLLTQTSPFQWAKIALITSIAQNALFLFVEAQSSRSTEDSHLFFAGSILLSSLVKIPALLYCNMIRFTGCVAIVSFDAWRTFIHIKLS